MGSFSDTKLEKSGSIRNRLSKYQQYKQSLLEKDKKSKKEPVLSIYAELSRNDYQQIMNGELEVCLPYGVTMKNKAGSRGLFFQCANEDVAKTLIAGLEASGVAWQED